ncbi:MAG: DUF3574 domain-containing protein [Phenylobacterium sp.]|nr:MAG: DUF3574 domain-containing protein [Phenylobacterium sp.]
MKRGAAPFAALALTGLTGCVAIDASKTALACPAGEAQQQVAELALGRNIGQTVGVSEADFTRFLDEEVSPRFPDGLTVQDSQGRWLYNGVLYREPGKLLTLILSHPGDRAKLAAIAAAYERRYRQDAVLIRVRPECVLFHMAKP